MRAKTVKKISYIFDFDDCLFTTSAKVHVIDEDTGEFIKSLTAEEFNDYTKPPNHFLDFGDFTDYTVVIEGTPYDGFYIMENVDKRISNGENSEIFVLTARTPHVQKAIFDLLKSKGIQNIKGNNIICMGDGRGEIDIPKEKGKHLKEIKKNSSKVFFYDDSKDNIIAADKLGINTKLIEEYIK